MRKIELIIVSIKIYKKVEIEWLKFRLNQKVEICPTPDIKFFLVLKMFKIPPL